MYKEHYLFDEIPDSTTIWKYLDFDKFLNLLVTESLYFCRADKFEDPYEGTITKETMHTLRNTLDGFGFNNVEEMFQETMKLLDSSRKMTLVNCWHINQFESDGMWKLYSKVKNAIAVQTTVGKLKRAFDGVPQDVHIGKVKYIDFDNAFIEGFTMMGPFVYKRQSFAHEQELRAVVWETGTKNQDELLCEDSAEDHFIPIAFVSHGKTIKVPVGKLVETVYFSPLSEPWFVEMVKSIIAKYDFDFQIVNSSLLSDPAYRVAHSGSTITPESVNLPVAVLKAFIEKDSFRLQREEDDRLRTIELQTEAVKNKLRLIETRISEIAFAHHVDQLHGAAAIAEIGKQFASAAKPDYGLLYDMNSNLFMLVGNFDNLMIDITSSIIPEREKLILIKEAFFLFTEKCLTGLSMIALRIYHEQDVPEEYSEALTAFVGTIFKFMKEIEERKI